MLDIEGKHMYFFEKRFVISSWITKKFSFINTYQQYIKNYNINLVFQFPQLEFNEDMKINFCNQTPRCSN